MGSPGDSMVKHLPANVGDMSLIPGPGKSPGEVNGTPLQYSWPGNPMDGEAWGAVVCGVAEELDMTERLHNQQQQQLTIVAEKNFLDHLVQTSYFSGERTEILKG